MQLQNLVRPVPFVLALSLAGTLGAQAQTASLRGAMRAHAPERQFDFWVGEWNVLNRHLQPGGEWVDGNTTRARYTPVVGGQALLEEWAGEFGAGYMTGFSLRSFNRALDTWEIALFWTMDGQGNFGTGAMRGGFRHGRGEFFTSTTGKHRTRFTFSDALPNTVRWDSATTEDGGANWNTSWIMEFERTRAGSEMNQDELFEKDWTEGSFSPHARARELDGLLGAWEGVQILADGTELEARLRARLVNKDCLVVDLLETRPNPEEDWHERLFVRGFCSPSQSWEGWRVSESEPALRKYSLTSSSGAFTFEHAAQGGAERESIEFLGDDWLVIEHEIQRTGESSPDLVSTTELQRVEVHTGGDH